MFLNLLKLDSKLTFAAAANDTDFLLKVDGCSTNMTKFNRVHEVQNYDKSMGLNFTASFIYKSAFFIYGSIFLVVLSYNLNHTSVMF